MDPADRELMDQLARGPFERDGFDQRLRRRIAEEIGKQAAGGAGRRRTGASAWPFAALASCAVVLLAVWMWNGQPAANLPDQATHSVASEEASAAPTALTSAEPAKKYALLIGLRKDDMSQAVPEGSYRTLLVADEEQPADLQLIADMPGLYMPYGQNFWQIVDTESPDDRHALHAVQVTGRGAGQKEKDDAARVPAYVLSERVSYAGNEYLSIQSSVKDEQGKTSERWLIKHIGQMNVKPDDPAAEPYTKLQDVLPEAGLDLEQGQSPQWSIYRNPGQWVSELYDPATGAERMIDNLPDNVIRNDTLLISWPDIEKIEPGARDAFTYGNVLGVVTDKEVVVRSMTGGAAESVRVPISGGESVVMIQWAQNDKIDYVDKWIQDFRGLLGN